MTSEIAIESPALSSSRGFTLLEVIIVIVVIGTIVAIAAPSFNSWRSSINASQSVKNMVDTLREARSRAMSTNFQHDVAVNVQNQRYQVLRGTQSYKTPLPPAVPGYNTANPVQGWVQLPTALTVTTGTGNNCGTTNNVDIQFNGDGTADVGAAPINVCIQSGPSTRLYRIRVASSGMITVE